MAPLVTTVDPWLPHSNRPKGAIVSTVVLHHTGGATAASTVQWLRGPWSALRQVFLGRSASYHFIIERDGSVYKCVPLGKKAWHAGISKGPFGHNVNAYSIGIAFANRGDGEAYTPQQKASAKWLIEECRKQFEELKYLSTHRLITSRKVDPAHFDFLAFAQTLPWMDVWMDKALKRAWNG